LDLLLRDCRLPDRDALADIAIENRRIAGIGEHLGSAREVVEVAGRLVTPGLVEAHIHLDKALLSGRVRAAAGTLEEAIRLTGEVKRRFTVDDIRARARRALEMAVAAGTTTLRSHVEIDPSSASWAWRPCCRCARSFRRPSICRSAPSPRRESSTPPGRRHSCGRRWPWAPT
jgi:cytosine deaminase